MAEIKLKPCPFCGSNVGIEEHNNFIHGVYYSVDHYGRCFVTIACVGNTPEELAAKWNRRSDNG